MGGVKMNELYHYGIPRRSGRYPWGSGERPYQGEEINKKEIKDAEKGKRRSESFNKDHVLKRGTIIYRSTPIRDEQNEKHSMYVSYLTPERNLYRSGTRTTINKDTGKVYERTMVLKKDLNIASHDKLKEVATKMSKDPNVLKESVKHFYDMLYPEDSYYRQEISYDWNTGYESKKIWDEYVNNAYEKVKNESVDETFGIMMASLGTNNVLKEKIISELKKEGYNAMQDLSGVRSNEDIEGIDPLIVFNPKDTIENIGVKEISTADSKRYEKKYKDWRRKAIRNF